MDGRRPYPRKNKKLKYKTKQKKLSKRTIETLLNKLFVLDNQEQNETAINEDADERDITTT